jgi:rhamnosyltransferase
LKVSIVIRCRNEEKHIGKLLRGIASQDYKDLEIIIVDSGSTDGTLREVSQFSVKIIHIKPEEFSFGRALNIGCEAASGEYLLFASAHVYPVYKDWITRMMTPLNEDKNIGLVYGQQRGNEITKYSENRIFEKWFPNEGTLDQSHPFCNNANCIIRKSLWEKQKYDETLTGLEDMDWAKKIMKLGVKISYVPEATIIHVHEEKWSQVFNRYRREAIALRLIMKHEKFNIVSFLTLLFGNIKSDLKHAREDGVLIKEFFSILTFRWMQFWGTYRGYKESYIMDNAVRERFYYPKGFIKSENEKELSREDHKIDY